MIGANIGAPLDEPSDVFGLTPQIDNEESLQLLELVRLWGRLDAAARSEILQLARQSASRIPAALQDRTVQELDEVAAC